MKAILIREFGSADVLCCKESSEPKFSDDELLIRVEAAGVNPVDTKIRAGKFPRFTPQLPAVLGRDVSGTVAAVGRDVTGFSEGDRVFGMLDYDRGGYAEFAAASPREIAKAPPELEHRALAALPVAALTAWQALFEHGKLRRGQRVLLHAANGGVGHFALQFAVNCGAETFATCSAADVNLVRDLGAAKVIDYQTQRFENEIRDLDLVLDLIGGETRERSWKTLKAGGILVSTLPQPIPPKGLNLSGREVIVYPNPEELHTIASLLESGEARVEIDRAFPLAECRTAHCHLEEEHSRGKTVLLLD